MSSEALQQFFRVVMPEFGNTLIMLGVSMVLSIFFGFVLAIVLIITKEDGLKPNRTVYKIMDLSVIIISLARGDSCLSPLLFVRKSFH